MGPTVGNPPVRSIYLYVALTSALFTSWIGTEILLPLLPLCWYGWHMPWGFYFYKERSITPLIFAFSRLSAMSTLEFLSYRRMFFVSEMYCCSKTPVSSPHMVSSISLFTCLCWGYLLRYYFFPIPHPSLRWGFHRTYMPGRLLGACLSLPVLWVIFSVLQPWFDRR